MTHDQLREALDDVGMSQMELARRLKRNPRTVRSWVKGTNPIPHELAILVHLMVTGRLKLDERYDKL